MLSGSATVFFAYIGFDAVASTAEEVNFFCQHLLSQKLLINKYATKILICKCFVVILASVICRSVDLL